MLNSSVVKIYIIYKTQTGTSCEICNSKAFQLGIKPASSGLLDQCSTTELQKPLLTTWVRVQYIINIPLYFTGITISLIYILNSRPRLQIPTHNFDFHLLTTSVNAKPNVVVLMYTKCIKSMW